MVAPKPPEGGWKNWFTTHPYQHTRYPVMRGTDYAAVWRAVDEVQPPTNVSNFDVVEIWYAPADNAVSATINGGPTICFSTHIADPEEAWRSLTERLFRHLLAAAPPTPPEPVGSGWDDFDWSK